MSAKYLKLIAYIRRLCGTLRRKGQAKLPGEMELAEKTGFSRQTVRHALSLLEQEGLIVRLRGSGTYLSEAMQRRSGRIAVLCCSTEEYLYPQLIRDIQAVCAPEGYTVECFATRNRVMKEREILTALLDDPPAGILMEASKSAFPSPNLDLLKNVERQGIPLVWIHAPLPVPEGAPCIQNDNVGGASLLVRHLLGKGHRQIAGIFKCDDCQGPERYKGFWKELLLAGCPLPEENILWYGSEDREALLRGDTSWLEAFLQSRLYPCTAVLCYNDEIAFPLIGLLQEEGRRVPEEVAVVSFDNSHYCPISPVPITSLTHERHQMGSTAARALLELIQGRTASSQRLPFTLVERQSG